MMYSHYWVSNLSLPSSWHEGSSTTTFGPWKEFIYPFSIHVPWFKMYVPWLESIVSTLSFPQHQGFKMVSFIAACSPISLRHCCKLLRCRWNCSWLRGRPMSLFHGAVHKERSAARHGVPVRNRKAFAKCVSINISKHMNTSIHQ